MPDLQNEKVIITLSGAGITFKADISALTATNVMRLCIATNHGGQDTLPVKTPDSLLGDEKVSLGEYVHKYEPTTYPEKILAIGAYLKDQKGKDSFSPEDIRPLFRTIGDVPPANFGRDFRVAIGNTWIAPEDNDSNAFYVTGIGFKTLRSQFTGGAPKKQKTRKRKKNGAVSDPENTEG